MPSTLLEAYVVTGTNISAISGRETTLNKGEGLLISVIAAWSGTPIITFSFSGVGYYRGTNGKYHILGETIAQCIDEETAFYSAPDATYIQTPSVQFNTTARYAALLVTRWSNVQNFAFANPTANAGAQDTTPGTSITSTTTNGTLYFLTAWAETTANTRLTLANDLSVVVDDVLVGPTGDINTALFGVGSKPVSTTGLITANGTLSSASYWMGRAIIIISTPAPGAITNVAPTMTLSLGSLSLQGALTIAPVAATITSERVIVAPTNSIKWATVRQDVRTALGAYSPVALPEHELDSLIRRAVAGAYPRFYQRELWRLTLSAYPTGGLITLPWEPEIVVQAAFTASFDGARPLTIPPDRWRLYGATFAWIGTSAGWPHQKATLELDIISRPRTPDQEAEYCTLPSGLVVELCLAEAYLSYGRQQGIDWDTALQRRTMQIISAFQRYPAMRWPSYGCSRRGLPAVSTQPEETWISTV